MFTSLLCSSLSDIADQLACTASTYQSRLTLQGQEQESHLQEWQGHEDPYPLLLKLVFEQHQIKAHWAHCAAQYHIGEMNAMPQ